MKIRPVGAELFYCGLVGGGQAGRHDESSNGFSQFCKGAKNVSNINTFLKPQEKQF